MERVQVRGLDSAPYPTWSEPFRAHSHSLPILIPLFYPRIGLDVSISPVSYLFPYDHMTPYLCTPSLSPESLLPSSWAPGLLRMHDYLYVVPECSLVRARTFVARSSDVCGACFVNIVFVVYAVYASSSLSLVLGCTPSLRGICIHTFHRLLYGLRIKETNIYLSLASLDSAWAHTWRSKQEHEAPFEI